MRPLVSFHENLNNIREKSGLSANTFRYVKRNIAKATEVRSTVVKTRFSLMLKMYIFSG